MKRSISSSQDEMDDGVASNSASCTSNNSCGINDASDDGDDDGNDEAFSDRDLDTDMEDQDIHRGKPFAAADSAADSDSNDFGWMTQPRSPTNKLFETLKIQMEQTHFSSDADEQYTASRFVDGPLPLMDFPISPNNREIDKPKTGMAYNLPFVEHEHSGYDPDLLFEEKAEVGGEAGTASITTTTIARRTLTGEGESREGAYYPKKKVGATSSSNFLQRKPHKNKALIPSAQTRQTPPRRFLRSPCTTGTSPNLSRPS